VYIYNFKRTPRKLGNKEITEGVEGEGIEKGRIWVAKGRATKKKGREGELWGEGNTHTKKKKKT